MPPFEDAPSLPRLLQPNQIDLWQLNVRSHYSQQASLLATLCDTERQRLQARNGWRLGLCRGLLRAILSQYLSVAPASLTFHYSAAGKPYVASVEGRTVEFNLSHSGDWLVCAVGMGPRPLGIDVECGRALQQLEALARRCLTVEEQQTLQGLTPAAQGERFIQYWTCKEAYAKAVGEGLRIPFAEIGVQLDPHPCFTHLPAASPDGWPLHLWPLASQAVVALAYPGPRARVVSQSFPRN